MADDNYRSGESSHQRLATGIVVVGFVILTIFLGYRQQHTEEREEAARQHQERAIAACRRGDESVVALACVEEALSATEEQVYTAYDLRAQQEMAEWALLMFLITFVGVFYVARTLDATQEAVVEAGKATAAATRANEIANTLSEAETRPLIIIGHDNELVPVYGEALQGKKKEVVGYKITIPFPNVGKGPAVSSNVWMKRIDIAQGGDIPKPDKGALEPVRTGMPLFPGMANFSASMIATSAKITALEEESLRVFFPFVIEYRRFHNQAQPYVTAGTIEIKVKGWHLHPVGGKLPIFEHSVVPDTAIIT